MLTKELVREIEARAAALRVRDGRLQVAKARRLPDYLLEAAREHEDEIVAWLEDREAKREAERRAREAEDAEAERKAKMPFFGARRLS